MRAKPAAQKAVTRSISLDPELVTRLDAHVESLRPEVKGLSHYIQLLLYRDLIGSAKSAPAVASAPARISTNPIKETEVFADGTSPDAVRVLPKDDYDVETDSFFRLFIGNTWPKFAAAA